MYELLEYADDGPVLWICLVATSGHLHMICIDTFDSLKGSRQIEL